MSDYRINVYENEETIGEEVIARVRYNACLDYWDGRNWTNGGVGMHKGLTKLKNGDYVLIIGTQWEGQFDYGFKISKNRALQEIMKSGNTKLLGTTKYKELKQLYEEMENQEVDEEEVDF